MSCQPSYILIYKYSRLCFLDDSCKFIKQCTSGIIKTILCANSRECLTRASTNQQINFILIMVVISIKETNIQMEIIFIDVIPIICHVCTLNKVGTFAISTVQLIYIIFLFPSIRKIVYRLSNLLCYIIFSMAQIFKSSNFLLVFKLFLTAKFLQSCIFFKVCTFMQI